MSGKRDRKPVKRENYYSEEQLKRILIDEYGLTEEDLEKDLQSSGGALVHVTQADILLPDRSTVTLYADNAKPDAKEAMGVLEFLRDLSDEDVLNIWGIAENHKRIGALIRNPGGEHEWLMVAALPYLKKMGIPLEWMQEYRTPTVECVFDIPDYNDDGEEDGVVQGIHGGTGSGRMHMHLFNCYVEAYKAFTKSKWRPGGREVLQSLVKNLTDFREKFFVVSTKPQALEDLIRMFS